MLSNSDSKNTSTAKSAAGEFNSSMMPGLVQAMYQNLTMGTHMMEKRPRNSASSTGSSVPSSGASSRRCSVDASKPSSSRTSDMPRSSTSSVSSVSSPRSSIDTRSSSPGHSDNEDDVSLASTPITSTSTTPRKPEFRRIRKNSREKQRRVELNELFEELSSVLEFEKIERKGNKIRKTCILMKAINQIDVLRKENARLQKQGKKSILSPSSFPSSPATSPPVSLPTTPHNGPVKTKTSTTSKSTSRKAPPSMPPLIAPSSSVPTIFHIAPSHDEFKVAHKPVIKLNAESRDSPTSTSDSSSSDYIDTLSHFSCLTPKTESEATKEPQTGQKRQLPQDFQHSPLKQTTLEDWPNFDSDQSDQLMPLQISLADAERITPMDVLSPTFKFYSPRLGDADDHNPFVFQ
eukprot:g74152.t1